MPRPAPTVEQPHQSRYMSPCVCDWLGVCALPPWIMLHLVYPPFSPVIHHLVWCTHLQLTLKVLDDDGVRLLGQVPTLHTVVVGARTAMGCISKHQTKQSHSCCLLCSHCLCRVRCTSTRICPVHVGRAPSPQHMYLAACTALHCTVLPGRGPVPQGGPLLNTLLLEAPACQVAVGER